MMQAGNVSEDVSDTQPEPTLLLLTIPEVFVYKLPQAKGSLISRGRRAEEWDLGNPLVTGLLKVVSVGVTVYVQIFKTDTELFAAAPIDVTADRPLEFFLESCTDTSRYFVLRIEDPKSKRHAYIGIGFRQRQSAFDLRAALVDQIRRNQRLVNMGAESAVEGGEADGAKDGPVQPSVDLSLKEGESIKVKINIPPGGRRAAKPKQSSAAPLSLRPPVQTGSKPMAQHQASANSGSSRTGSQGAEGTGVEAAAEVEEEEDDDWGDFQS